MKKEYAVFDNLDHDGKRYTSDDSVELTVEQATPLLEVGVIGETGNQDTGNQDTGNQAPEGEEKITAIKDAIESLDKENKELFNADGETPKPDAIAKVTGWPVSAKERDEALALIEPEGGEE